MQTKNSDTWFRRLRQDLREFWWLPEVSVNLMRSAAADNDPFYDRLVVEHFRSANRRRARHMFLQQMVHGVALCQLPEGFDKYYMRIEASARRNHKKSLREGCEFRRIVYNDHLVEIAAIRSSTDVRQGRLVPEEYRQGIVRPISDPPSRNQFHDYVYFGAFMAGKLIAYAGCLIAGEFCGVEQVLGHADYLPTGAVPLLYIEIARHLYANHPQVKFYAYGTYFGASETLRRFKRKFDFHPHRVKWVLDAPRLFVQQPPSCAERAHS